MYVTVHRGTRQIGGNLIEIGTSQTRMLFDAGANLPPLDGPKTEDSFELKGTAVPKSEIDIRPGLVGEVGDNIQYPLCLLPSKHGNARQ